jgi:hypothetical protein
MANVDTSIQRALRLPDPLLDWKWVYSTATLPLGLDSSYIESVDLPFNNIVANSVNVAGGSISFPGVNSVAAVSMSLYEDRYCNTLNWIQTWKNLIKDLGSGIFNTPDKYKFDLKFTLLDNKNIELAEVILVNCFPTDTGNHSLNYSGNGRIVISQSFSVDGQSITFKAPGRKTFGPNL